VVAEPEVFALVFAVAELSPGVVVLAAELGVVFVVVELSPEAVFVAAELSPEVVVLVELELLVEPELLVASESVPDVAELLASGDTAVVFVVLIPVSVALVEADSSGHPRFFAFPNTCSFPKYSSSSGHGCRESVHSSTGVHTNHESCSILSNLGLYQNTKLEWCCNNPILGYNSVTDTNDLPKISTKNHHRNRGLHQYWGQHRHMYQVALSLVVVRQIRWVVVEEN
jgi:hypothetical protein